MNTEIDNLWQLHSIQLASISFINFVFGTWKLKGNMVSLCTFAWINISYHI